MRNFSQFRGISDADGGSASGVPGQIMEGTVIALVQA
jgi:hypothetical protein